MSVLVNNNTKVICQGVTWELDIAHYFKRLSAIDLLFGNADYHLDRFVDNPVHI